MQDMAFARCSAEDDGPFGIEAMISERETVQACRELLTTHGLVFVGGSSGTAFAAVKRYAARISASEHPTVLFLCADRGTPYLDTVSSRVGDQARVAGAETMHFELSIINGKAVFDISAPVGRHASRSFGMRISRTPRTVRQPDSYSCGSRTSPIAGSSPFRPSSKRLRRGRAEVDRQLSWQHPARFSSCLGCTRTQ